MQPDENVGILLINTGSPDAPKTPQTRAYLRQFLSDPRVIDISPIGRWFLLNFIILPFRPPKSAHAYQQIWAENGSPLIVNSIRFRDMLAAHYPNAKIEIGMAYGNPSIPAAMAKLISSRVSRLILAPMFPQYASATVGSVLELAYKTAAAMPNVPSISVVRPFYDNPRYLDAWAAVARPHLEAFKPDHILLSYHGLPKRQIFKCDPTGAHCLKSAECCEKFLAANPHCYRAHCLATTHGIVERLNLSADRYTVCFQSKLGREPWLSPATDKEIVAKAKAGVKRLAIVSPAFVADCLETLEELGLRGKQAFLESGGEEFLLVPSLNADHRWVESFGAILQLH